MPDLFGLDIAGIVADAIGSAGGLLPAILIKKTPGTVSAADRTAGTSPTSEPYPCEGCVVDHQTSLVAGSLVKVAVRSVMILGATLPAGVVPEPNDQVTIEDKTYTLVRLTSRDPAAAQYTFQVTGAP